MFHLKLAVKMLLVNAALKVIFLCEEFASLILIDINF